DIAAIAKMQAFVDILVMVAKFDNCPYFPSQMVILSEKWAVPALDLPSGTYIKHKLNYLLGIGHRA
ncbi:hypothetical protein VF11_27560, partial [Nostoc linckia z14]